MCGIVGATSNRNVVPILIEGIRRLEYRGYDSTGLAVINGGASPALERLVSTARVADLAAQADARHLHATTGISHTRWATHGAPTPDNAHPHLSGGEVAVVHNGIIENYETLRDRLKARGYVFQTQTDTEVIAHLVHAHWHGAAEGDLLAAVRLAIAEFEGAYAIASSSTREPGRVVGASRGQPARRGHRRGRSLPRLGCGRAPARHAARRVSRGGRRGGRAGARGYVILDATGRAVERTIVRGGRRRRCGRARPPIATTCRRRSSSSRARSPTRSTASRRSARAVRPEGRGDPAAGRLGADPRVRHELLLEPRRQAVDRDARALPCAVEIASEYRYRDSVPRENALVVVVSQSGETADTLAALKHAKRSARTRSRSATSRRARWCARRSSCSSRAPAPRSASRRPRRSPRSSPRSSCSR
jgi:glucosamine--fructose-6-phosphate aminotransferase (isomerizing)